MSKEVEQLSAATPEYLRDVLDERSRQDEKWGVQNHDPERWLAILLEEVGEAAKDALEGSGALYRDEMVHVAAVALAAVECFDRNRSFQHADAEKLRAMIVTNCDALSKTVPTIIDGIFENDVKFALEQIMHAESQIRGLRQMLKRSQTLGIPVVSD